MSNIKVYISFSFGHISTPSHLPEVVACIVDVAQMCAVLFHLLLQDYLFTLPCLLVCDLVTYVFTGGMLLLLSPLSSWL